MVPDDKPLTPITALGSRMVPDDKPLSPLNPHNPLGFRMVPDDKPRCEEPGRYFKFVHSSEYIESQRKFEKLAALGDPDALMVFIKRFFLI